MTFDEPGINTLDRTADERRMSAIVADVLDNADKLVEQHLALAMVELERRVEDAKKEVSVVASSLLILYLGALAGVASLILGLSTVTSPWLAALIVSLTFLVLGFAMLQRKREQSTTFKNTQSTQSIKRTAHSLEEALK